MVMRALRQWLIPFATLCFLLSQPHPSQGQERKAATREKARIATSAKSLAAMPVYLAAQQGFFTREGVEVQILIMRTPVAMAALISGHVDYMTAFGSGLQAAMRGASVKGVATFSRTSQLWILGRKEIQGPLGLKGKVIGVGGVRGTHYYTTQAILRHFGIGENQVKILSTGDVRNGFAALEQGVIDAAALTAPYNVMAKRLGYQVLARSADIVGEWPQDGLVTTVARVQGNPAQIRILAKALIRTMQFAKTQRRETVEFIVREHNLGREIAEEVYEAIIDTFNPTLAVGAQAIQAEIDRFSQETKSRVSAQVADLVDFSFVREAAREVSPH